LVGNPGSGSALSLKARLGYWNRCGSTTKAWDYLKDVRGIYTNFMQLVPNGPEDRCRGSFFNEYKLTRMFLFISFYTRIILIDISLIQGILGSELF
jgi:hypothetical protein